MDIDYLLWLQQLREATGGVLDSFFEAVSYAVASSFAFIIIAGIYWCIDKKAGAMIFMNLSGGNVANQTLKNIFCVYRPWIRDPRIVPAGDAVDTATGYSFPSGHAQYATAELGTIAVWQRKRKWLAALCIVGILLVMFSRNYLGVHTPQDVIVGFVLCGAVIAANIFVVRWADKKPNRDWIVFGVGMALCFAFLAFISLKEYPFEYTDDGSLMADPIKMITDGYAAAGYFIGFLIGWIIERHFIRFEVPKGIASKIITFIVGGGLLYGVSLILKPVKNSIGLWWGELVYFVLIFLFIMAGYPALMKLAEKLFDKKGKQRLAAQSETEEK